MKQHVDTLSTFVNTETMHRIIDVFKDYLNSNADSDDDLIRAIKPLSNRFVVDSNSRYIQYSEYFEEFIPFLKAAQAAAIAFNRIQLNSLIFKLGKALSHLGNTEAMEIFNDTIQYIPDPTILKQESNMQRYLADHLLHLSILEFQKAINFKP